MLIGENISIKIQRILNYSNPNGRMTALLEYFVKSVRSNRVIY